ncbi:hypothetical protein [Streptomyces yangpuensis]|uniref:hypothetical protein n=1 Tax=Streptomyces yangpuensis TaxID=1648182 RepID=UPI0007C8145F|nr:hypothetical protein [Streptomyces yangpuensis]
MAGLADGGLTDACAGWLLRGDALVRRARRDGTDHLARAARRDWTWGTATARRRLLHRLRTVAAMTAGHPALAGVSDLTTAMHHRMLTRRPALRPVPAVRPSATPEPPLPGHPEPPPGPPPEPPGRTSPPELLSTLRTPPEPPSAPGKTPPGEPADVLRTASPTREEQAGSAPLRTTP